MSQWTILDLDRSPDGPIDPNSHEITEYFQEIPPLTAGLESQAQQYQPPPPPMSPTVMLLFSPKSLPPKTRAPSNNNCAAIPKGKNPREIRNKAEKQRRDKLNQSITQLATMVPPVIASRKIDKTGVLRLTAHYLRSHQYVFGDSIGQPSQAQDFKAASAQAVLDILNGFLLTTTYRGIIVVVSQNVQEFLGYSELDLLGQNIFHITHPEDFHTLMENLMPNVHLLGPNGELLVPDEPDAKEKLITSLANDKRKFIVRFKKHTQQRSEPTNYVTCYVEGTMRKSDRARRGNAKCCQMVRRARARGVNPCSSGNDVVFIGVVRPSCETFISERNLESFNMEYRTRHLVDGQILECEQRISLVTGYMTHEVTGINAMNFMHRDDVRWVIIALREMYDQHRIVGESCYRLITKNGQFIYMRTRGRLDVEDDTGSVRSFVCTNTVVGEQEGKYLIKMMKKKFMLMVNNTEDPPQEDDTKDDNQSVSVEDPKKLQNVILHLVTNLPSPQASLVSGKSPSLKLAILPPKTEEIVNAIEKIHSIIKNIHSDTNKMKRNEDNEIKELYDEKKTEIRVIKTVALRFIPTLNRLFEKQKSDEEPFNTSVEEISVGPRIIISTTTGNTVRTSYANFLSTKGSGSGSISAGYSTGGNSSQDNSFGEINSKFAMPPVAGIGKPRKQKKKEKPLNYSNSKSDNNTSPSSSVSTEPHDVYTFTTDPIEPIDLSGVREFMKAQRRSTPPSSTVVNGMKKPRVHEDNVIKKASPTSPPLSSLLMPPPPPPLTLPEIIMTDDEPAMTIDLEADFALFSDIYLDEQLGTIGNMAEGEFDILKYIGEGVDDLDRDEFQKYLDQ